MDSQPRAQIVRAYELVDPNAHEKGLEKAPNWRLLLKDSMVHHTTPGGMITWFRFPNVSLLNSLPAYDKKVLRLLGLGAPLANVSFRSYQTAFSETTSHHAYMYLHMLACLNSSRLQTPLLKHLTAEKYLRLANALD